MHRDLESNRLDLPTDLASDASGLVGDHALAGLNRDNTSPGGTEAPISRDQAEAPSLGQIAPAASVDLDASRTADGNRWRWRMDANHSRILSRQALHALVRGRRGAAPRGNAVGGGPGRQAGTVPAQAGPRDANSEPTLNLYRQTKR